MKPIDGLDLRHIYSPYRAKVEQLLRKYAPMWDGSLGEISTTEHHIDLLSNTRPVRQQPYRAGPRAREIEQAEVEKMLRAGVIEPSTSA